MPICGLVESARFGFSVLHTVGYTGIGDGLQQYQQSGLPPGGIGFGRKIYGSAEPTQPAQQKQQSGLPPDAIRFGFKPYGSSSEISATTTVQTGDPGGYAGAARHAIIEGRIERRRLNALAAERARLEELGRPKPAPVVEPKPTKETPKLAAQSPLPMVANFGQGNVTIGIQAPLNDLIEQQLMADEEDAMIAILLLALK